MALRTKTIEQVFPQDNTSLGSATRRDQSAITLYIPENTSRTFRSVVVDISCRDTQTSGTSLTSWLIGIKLGSASFDDVTVTDTIGNTSDPMGFHFTRDVTSYFTLNFGSGTSQTCQVGTTFGAVGVINISIKIIITYEFDDSSQTTRIKTVKIPLESYTTTLTNSLAEMGTNQVPNLDSFLPEASKTYRDIWFEVTANEIGGSTTDYVLALSLDSEGESQDGNHEAALDAGAYVRRIWQRNDMSTSATHAFKARSTVTGRFMWLAVVLCVTYEYDHSSSTTILNSLQMPLSVSGAGVGGSSGDREQSIFKFMIEEPTTITLVQSGVWMRFMDPVSMGTIPVRAGSQSTRTYTYTAAVTANAGPSDLIHRIDSGGAQGAGISIARGENTFTLEFYRTGSGIGFGQHAMLYLNYTSGKASGGADTHAHTTKWLISEAQADNYEITLTAKSTPTIPESSYWIVAAGYWFSYMANMSSRGVGLRAEVVSGDTQTDGWIPVSCYSEFAEASLGHWPSAEDASRLFWRYPSDSDTYRLNPESTRKYLWQCTESMWPMEIYMYVTYHSMTFTLSGNVIGYTGSGSGITVTAHRADTGEVLGSTTTSSGGAYTITVYDSAINFYTEAVQDSTHRGRSANGTAS